MQRTDAATTFMFSLFSKNIALIRNVVHLCGSFHFTLFSKRALVYRICEKGPRVVFSCYSTI